MSAAIIIPARFASTRLPGKPLLAETGKPLIQHVYERARQVKNASAVIVATDDQRILDAVLAFGGDAVMTSDQHQTGTARIAQAAAKLDVDTIVNLQGDEPEINPRDIETLIELQTDANPFASTLVCAFSETASAGPGSPDDENAVKAILGKRMDTSAAIDAFKVRYFTRHLCAWPRDELGHIVNPSRYHLHVGIYAFSRASLMRFANTATGALEQAERLEQLRILEMGEGIAAALIAEAPPGIDTPEDYRGFVVRSKKDAA